MNISAVGGGLNTFLIGVTIVFVALVLLIILIKLVSRIVGSIDNASKENSQQAIAKKEEVPVATISAAAPQMDASQDELELVAVITAAIAASLGTTSDRLQVRSLRKVDRRTR
ncbi:MAG: OadG family transporter subunit [Cellulosilyticaceae bacterium]